MFLQKEQLTRSYIGVTNFASEIILGELSCSIKNSVLDTHILMWK